MYTKIERSIPITAKQRNLIIGSVLGDATLTKSRNKKLTACIRFSHSTKQLEYAKYKSQQLQSMSNHGVEVVTYFQKSKGKPYTSARYTSIYTRELYELYSLFYDKNGVKNIPDQIEQWLNPESIAYWYMDDGGISKRNNRRNGKIYYINNELSFHTNCFPLLQVEKLRDALIKTIGVEFRPKKVDYGKHWILYTKNRQQITKFVGIMKPLMHPDMLYKCKLAYKNPIRKKYDKNKLSKIAKKLNLSRCKDFKKYRRGTRIYDSIRHHFGSLDNFRKECFC